MDCRRCLGKIHSGKIMKHMVYEQPLLKTYYYCKHCFNALKLK